MADATTPTPAGNAPITQPAPQPPTTGSDQGGKKFAGKYESPEALEAAYLAAQSKISEYGEKYKGYDEYAKIGPPDKISEAITWARSMKQALDAGLLVPKDAAAPRTQPTTPTVPWESENWELQTDAQRSAALASHVQSEVKKYVDGIAGQYGDQIQSQLGRDAREKAIMLKAVQMAMRNPSVDVDALLNKAAEYSSKSPDELLDIALGNLTDTPESRQSKIEAEVSKRLAEELQKQQAKQWSDITVTPKPRFGRQPKGRQEEDRAILESLSKQGINLLR